jgi:Periplasmic binding protein
MLPASSSNRPDRETSKLHSLRRWGPIGALVTVALVVGAVLLFDDDADAPDELIGVDSSPTVATEDDTTPSDQPIPTEPGGSVNPVPTATDPSPPVDEIPDALSFTEAAEAGFDVEWGDRCDTTTGRLAVVDYFAPECYAPFTGDNGGETDQGVTADTIKIVLYQGPEDDFIIRYITDALSIDETNQQEADTISGMIDYFEAYYETYGRTVELIPYVSSGIASDEVTARADAVRIAEEFEPFMVWDGPDLTSAFADELAARGVLCLSCTPAQPPDWYVERDPFMWQIDASGTQKQSHAAELILKQLAGKPAEFGGDDVSSTQRRFGLLYIESSANSKPQADELTATLAAGGVDIVETVSYVLDPTSIQQTASQAIAQFKAAGVTTVLLTTDPIAPRDFTREATAQQYFPEWVVSAPTLTDTTAFARTYDQEQWAHAFGITALAARIVPEQSGYYRLYQWYNGEPPPAADQIGVLAPFPAVFYGALQGAGPDLTRENWADALKGLDTIPAVTQPYLSWGGPLVWPYVDYTGIDDATLIWWDPTATGPDEIRREGTGMWQYADGGVRFLPGAWPTESRLFDPESSVTIFEEPPPDEAPPDYPSPAG